MAHPVIDGILTKSVDLFGALMLRRRQRFGEGPQTAACHPTNIWTRYHRLRSGAFRQRCVG